MSRKRTRTPRTFGFSLVGKLLILAAALAAVAALGWPMLSSWWTNPGREPRQLDISLPTLGPTTTTTYPTCNVLSDTPPDAPPVIQNWGPCIAPTTAQCRDGTKVAFGKGACAGHGGVAGVSR